MLYYAKTEWDRCACADFYSVGRGRAVEVWAGRRAAWANCWCIFLGWPPFTSCWLVCYIKETPPTAAPDNLQHWHGGRGGTRRCSPICLHHLQEGHFSAQAVWNLPLSYSPCLLHRMYEPTQIVHIASCWLCSLWPWRIFYFLFFAWICKLSLANVFIFCS